MLKRVNWFAIIGVFFMVLGVLFLLIGDWIQAAWGLALGGCNLFVAYGRRHPEVNQKRWAWPFVMGLCIVLAVLTILKLTRT